MTEAILRAKNLIRNRRNIGIELTLVKSIKIETLNILLISGIIVSTILYLFTSNSIALANYRKTTLQKSIESLKTEIRSLNLELTDKRSITFLKKAAEEAKLVVNENIQYIKVVGPVVRNNP